MLEEPSSCGVRTSTIAEDKDGLGLRVDMPDVLFPLFSDTVAGELCRIMAGTESEVAYVFADIIDAVGGYLARGKALEITVEGLDGPFGVSPAAVSSEVADKFLLLGVHTENRLAGSLLRPAQLSYLAELCIPVFALAHRQVLCRLAMGVAFDFDDLFDHIKTDIYMVIILEHPLYLAWLGTEPFRVGVLGEAGDVALYNLTEYLDVFRMRGENRLPSASGFPNTFLAFTEFSMRWPLQLLYTTVDGLAVHGKSCTHDCNTVRAVFDCQGGRILSSMSFIHAFEQCFLRIKNIHCKTFRNHYFCSG